MVTFSVFQFKWISFISLSFFFFLINNFVLFLSTNFAGRVTLFPATCSTAQSWSLWTSVEQNNGLSELYCLQDE